MAAYRGSRKNKLERAVEDNDPDKLQSLLDKKTFDGISKSEALCVAAQTMNFACVEILLDAKASMFTEIQRRNALYYAVKNSHGDIVNMMLDYAGDSDRAKAAMRAALFEASANGALESVDILLRRGTDPNSSHYHDSEFVSMCPPLVAACYGPFLLRNYCKKFSDVAMLLIKYGAKLEVSDAFSETALHWACFNQLTEVVETMLERAVNVDVGNGIGKTPLMGCIEGLNHHGLKYSMTLDLIISMGANVNLLDYDNFSALHYAILASDEVVELLLKSGATPDLSIDYVGLGMVTALGMAILEQSWNSVRHLVMWNADVNLPCFTSGRWIPFTGLCDAEQYDPKHATLLGLAGSDLWQMRKQLLVVHTDQLTSVTSQEKREQWNWLLRYATKPRSLRELCRLRIRKQVSSTHSIKKISNLPLPKSVIAYLYFSDL